MPIEAIHNVEALVSIQRHQIANICDSVLQWLIQLEALKQSPNSTIKNHAERLDKPLREHANFLVTFMNEWDDIQENAPPIGFNNCMLMYGYAMLLPLFLDSCQEAESILLPPILLSEQPNILTHPFQLRQVSGYYSVYNPGTSHSLESWQEESRRLVDSSKIMILPVNRSNAHWTFLVIDPSHKRIIFVDPMSSGYSRALREELKTWATMATGIQRDWGYHYLSFGAQGSDNNCGVYCAELMTCFTREIIQNLDEVRDLGPGNRSNVGHMSRQEWETTGQESKVIQAFAERVRNKCNSIILPATLSEEARSLVRQSLEELDLPRNSASEDFRNRRVIAMQVFRTSHLWRWLPLLNNSIRLLNLIETHIEGLQQGEIRELKLPELEQEIFRPEAAPRTLELGEWFNLDRRCLPSNPKEYSFLSIALEIAIAGAVIAATASAWLFLAAPAAMLITIGVALLYTIYLGISYEKPEATNERFTAINTKTNNTRTVYTNIFHG